MSSLPVWMRAALFATAAMNIIGAAAFLPGAQALRSLAGFPDAEHPVYLVTVGIFILVLGLGYLGCAVMNRADRLFIAVGAAGKLAFFFMLISLWLRGELPVQAPLAGGGDFFFGIVFTAWLVQTRAKS